MRQYGFWALLFVLGFARQAQAVNYGLEKWGTFERDFEEETVAWQEVQAQMPAAPKPDNLISFKIDLRPGYVYALDQTSLSVGGDGVVRYTIVITSPSGAHTVNFEGMRCTTGERKIYAFGRSEGTWSKNRNARWEPIQARSQTGYPRVLFYEFLCIGGEGIPTVARIQERLRQGGYRAD